jgi:hypothetical protein
MPNLKLNVIDAFKTTVFAYVLFLFLLSQLLKFFFWGRLFLGFGSNPYPIFSELPWIWMCCAQIPCSIIYLLNYYLLCVTLCLFNPPKAEKKRRKFLFYFYRFDVVAVSALFRSIRS